MQISSINPPSFSNDSLENTLMSWSTGPGKVEQQMCENAEQLIKNAISSDNDLSKMDISVFIKGSFKNRTNIAGASDVDVCIRLNSVFYGVYPTGKKAEDFGYVDGKINFTEFKKLVSIAIRNYIKVGEVEVGDKSIKIKQNSYRVDADLVPAFVHKLWNKDKNYNGSYNIRAEGIGIYSDKEQRRIYNWPSQDYTNGCAKNSKTNRMFKRQVRILKNLQENMKDNGVLSDGVASFLIESMVWNVPSDLFFLGEYIRTTRSVLAFIYNNLLLSKFDYTVWTEVNDIKFLFHETQPWTREQAFNFIDKAWNYLGFE